ncbi:MAG: Ig-like domain-containing protein, partial [Thermoanaerobaculia bacterium]
MIRRSSLLVCLLLFGASSAVRAQIASGDLMIRGSSLEVVNPAVGAHLDTPVTIQTRYAGQTNENAPVVDDVKAAGDLTGPGLPAPLRLETAPGWRFTVPGLPEEGTYFLQNIRLESNGRFVASASPSTAMITVANVMKPSVSVRQLSPEELRARGISLDGRNFEVYEYTFSFNLDSSEVVTIPYLVVVDPITHDVTPLTHENPYTLPSDNAALPERWSPPPTIMFELAEQGGSVPQPPPTPFDAPRPRPSIPAAIVLPNSLAVLHQFFGVMLMVSNGAPTGSSIELDSVTGTIQLPPELRVSKTNPSVSFGRPVPVLTLDGQTVLVAQADGKAEYVLEGLKSGTHTIDIEVRATMKQPGQAGIPLAGTVRSSIIVYDPRFNITFSHPDVVRADEPYSTWTFITNASPVAQTIEVATGVQPCSMNVGSVCLPAGSPATFTETIPAGDTKAIDLKLVSRTTGRIYASAGSIGEGGAIASASVALRLGVSESGVPLSAATLVMPHYARYLDPDFVSANLRLLGIGYSVATAPRSTALSKFPAVVKSDVFHRAADIARAGQRIFIGDAPRDAFANLALDLLGNERALADWDQLRRSEESGVASGKALATEIAKASLDGADRGFEQLLPRFASATAHRNAFAAVLVHGPAIAGNARPYALTVRALDAPGDPALAFPNELRVSADVAWRRQIPYADLLQLNDSDSAIPRTGELALLGVWSGRLEVGVKLAVGGSFEIEAIFPGENNAKLYAKRLVAGAAGDVFTFTIDRGQTDIDASQPVALPELRIVAARQDLYLDPHGHKVSTLFNRPVAPAADWASKFSAEVVLTAAANGLDLRRARGIEGAALQTDGRILDLNFSQALAKTASYEIVADGVDDPLRGVVVPRQTIVPVVDNDKAGGIVYGRVLSGSNEVIRDAAVAIAGGGYDQFDRSDAAGTYLFEFVPRDVTRPGVGTFTLYARHDGRETQVAGAIRAINEVRNIDLVFRGRGSAEGVVRDQNGVVVVGATVTVGSVMFSEVRQAVTDVAGRYRVGDLSVGPLTFTARDDRGNIVYAAAELRTPGELLLQDLTLQIRENPGTGSIRGRVIRSDEDGAPAVAARVRVYTQGYGFDESGVAADGTFAFDRVPAGLVSVNAADWAISRETAVVDFDLRADETRDIGTLIIQVPATGESGAMIAGVVARTSGVVSSPVPNAIVEIGGLPAVVADAAGQYQYPNVPLRFANTWAKAYDPVTKESGRTLIPALMDGATVNVPINLTPAESIGRGTIRVVLTDAAGQLVSGYRVISPGYPAWEFEARAAGVYERKEVYVGNAIDVWAIPPASGSAYGDQIARGTAQVAFDGQVASVALRLPGQGTVKARLVRKLNSTTTMVEPGRIKISYRVWSETEQGYVSKDVVAPTQATDGDYATFIGVPAGETLYLESFEHTGSASASTRIMADGSVRAIDLMLTGLSTVRGRVFDIDGMTPLAGAVVQIEDGVTSQGSRATDDVGAYDFHNVGSGKNIKVTARATVNGIERVGFATATTPAAGGIVEDVDVTMREAGTVHGTIVLGDGDSDPTNNPIAANANFWLRELDFPQREFGSESLPLQADANGEFHVSNVFRGPFRVSARDANSPDLRGEASGAVDAEGALVHVRIEIGQGGAGDVTLTVLSGSEPVASAEVSLFRGENLFDFATTDAQGEVTFRALPADDDAPQRAYSAAAYSKALSSASPRAAFDVVHGQVATATLYLLQSAEVYGTLTDPHPPDGGATRAVGSAHVTLSASSYETRSTTNSAGAFELKGVRPGSFRLAARDPQSQRRATLDSSVASGERAQRDLALEPAFPLTVNAYLPTDSGAKGALAPAVAVEVRQGGEYLRSAQGNQLVFEGLVARLGYFVTVTEIGGEQRVVRESYDAFASNPAPQRVDVTFPAYGSVRARVTSPSSETSIANARVEVHGNGTSAFAFTDASGFATVQGIRLGDVSAQVTSFDGKLTASAAGTLTSQTIPAELSLTLGSYAGVTGLVIAEDGGPAVGTRVAANFNSTSVETRTDGDGRYTFRGIAVNANASTGVTLRFWGPDDVTVGAQDEQTWVSILDAIKTVRTIQLDATAPRLLSYFPADGAVQVSPDASLVFEFSEPVSTTSLVSAIRATPFDSEQVVGATFRWEPVGERFRITMTPAPVQGQTYPLRSNTLYQVVVSDVQLRDAVGHPLPAPRAFTFRTSDYAAPRVRAYTPPAGARLATNQIFEFAFTEPLDPSHWAAGGDGRVILSKRDAAGSWSEVNPGGTPTLDAATNAAIRFAPAAPIEANARYRIAFAGVVDLQGNAMQPGESGCACEWDSVDTIEPQIALVSPVPAGVALVERLAYEFAAVSALDTDIARVEFFRTDSGTDVYLGKDTTAPYAWALVAPVGASSLGLKAIAWDTSENASAPAELTVPVLPNAAPRLALTPSAQVPTYAGATVAVAIAVDDEGLRVPISIQISGTEAIWNGASWSEQPYAPQPVTKDVARNTLAHAWPALSESVTLPHTLKGGSNLTVKVTATDLQNLSTEATATIPIAVDAVPPAVTILKPVATDVFDEGGSNAIAVEATIADGETGVAEARVLVDTASYSLAHSPTAENPDRYTATIPVPDAGGIDVTQKTLTIEARDWARGTTTSSVTVGIRPNVSPLDPVVRFTCGAGGMYPAGYGATITVHAVGNAINDGTRVTKVEFYFNGEGTPSVVIPVTTPPADNLYQTTYTVPASATDIPIRVVVYNNSSDATGNPRSTTIETTITVIVPDRIFEGTEPIDTNAWAGKTIVVKTGAHEVSGTASLRRFVVLKGASVAHPQGSGVGVTISAPNAFVECGASIDVSGRGYAVDQSYPGAGVSTQGSGGSHLGEGGFHGLTGAVLGKTYGSVTQPRELGSGGSWCCGYSERPVGGGRVEIDTKRLVLDGAIRANGMDGAGAAAGGSVWIHATGAIVGNGTIEARGGKPGISGGGGGAIAIEYGAEPQGDEPSGWKNGLDARGATLDGGTSVRNSAAGTIFVHGPQSVHGTLSIDNKGTLVGQATVLPS